MKVLPAPNALLTSWTTLKAGDLFIAQEDKARLLCLFADINHTVMVVILGVLEGNFPDPTPVAVYREALKLERVWTVPKAWIEAGDDNNPLPAPEAGTIPGAMVYFHGGTATICLDFKPEGYRWVQLENGINTEKLSSPVSYRAWRIRIPGPDEKPITIYQNH